MKRVDKPKLYKQYFVNKYDERIMLFQKVNELYHPKKGFYPGSFVHITPSFFIKNMTYIDNDKRISKFFNSDNLIDFIEENKTYEGMPVILGIQADYSSTLPIEESSFDIMFSFYAGFISQKCKKYLKEKGILIANDSHGDASIAYTDEDYELIGIVKRNGIKFSITDKDLHKYFNKKDGNPIDKTKVLDKMSGENFTKKGYAYIFMYHPNEKNST